MLQQTVSLRQLHFSSIMDNQMVATTTSPAKPAIQHRKITWPDEQSVQQAFSLPSSVIYYISKNPSTPTAYLRLVQSCKYFFEKLPILIAKDFYEENGKTRLCTNDDVECEKNKGKCCININVAKISSKMWLTNCLSIRKSSASLVSSKLYQCDVNGLSITNQEVKFDNFKFMASAAVTVSLRDVKMFDNNGNDVKIDAILGFLKNIQRIENFYGSGSLLFDSSTLKNIANLKNLSKLQSLDLYDIPEVQKIEAFVTFMKEHKDAKFYLKFDKNISEEFKNQLNALIDTVIKDKVMKCVILYNGLDNGKVKIMKSRYLD